MIFSEESFLALTSLSILTLRPAAQPPAAPSLGVTADVAVLPQFFHPSPDFSSGGGVAGVLQNFKFQKVLPKVGRGRTTNSRFRRIRAEEGVMSNRPKPLTCAIEGTVATVTWNVEELREYLKTTTDIILWVEDAEGTQIPIRVGFLREQFGFR
jgi:hypothetical protein